MKLIVSPLMASFGTTHYKPQAQTLRSHCLRSSGLLLLLVLLGLTNRELRGDDAPPALPAQGTTTSAHEPAALVVVAGVDRLLEDVDYLCEIGQMPHLAQLVRGGVTGLNELAGIDRSLPGGAMLFLDPEHPDSEPVPLLFLPVNNMASLQETAQRFGLTIEPVAGKSTPDSAEQELQHYTILLGEVPHPLVFSEGYVRVTKPGMRPVDVTPTQIRDLSKPLARDYDVAVSVRRVGIPAALFQQARATLEADIARELERKPDESDRVFNLRTRVQKGVFQTMLAVLEQSHGLLAGFHMSREEPGGHLKIQLQTAESKDLSHWFEAMSLPEHRFLDVCEVDAALSLLLGARLNQEGTAIGTQIVDFMRHEAERKPIPELTATERQQVLQFLDSLQSTIDAGIIEGFAQFREQQGAEFIVLAGLTVANPDGLQSAMQVLLPHLKQAPNVARVETCAAIGDSLNLHCITPKQVRSRDTKLYGNDVALYVGTGRESGWLALGSPATPAKLAHLEQLTPALAERPHRRPVSETTRDQGSTLPAPVADADAMPTRPFPLAKLSLHLKGWLPLAAEETGRAAVARKLIQESFPAETTDDHFTATLQSTGNGLSLKLHVDPGYIRLAFKAAALQQSAP